VEALIPAGEWEEARRRPRTGRQWARIPHTQGCLETHEGELARLAGDVARAEECAERARQSPSGENLQPRNAVPMAGLGVRVARRTGRFAAARATLPAALATEFAPGVERYAWPPLFHGARAEGDSRGLPGPEDGGPQALERIASAAAGPRVREPVWQAWAHLVQAEISRARGGASRGCGRRAVAPVEPTGRPCLPAMARYRHAEALPAAGEREFAAEALGRAAEAAGSARRTRAGRSGCPPSGRGSRWAGPSGRGPDGARRRAGAGAARGAGAAAGRGGPLQPPDRRGAVHPADDGERGGAGV
jgi:hypothetical protein